MKVGYMIMKGSCENWTEYFPADKFSESLYEEFESRAKNVSTEVYRIQSLGDAKKIVADIISDVDARKVSIAADPMIEESGIIDAIKAAGISCYTTKEDIAANRHDADIGISRVEFGVAEFGGVCQNATAIEDRLVSTLPPLHIAFMKSKYIVPGVEDVLDIISRTFDSGYISWITGPSRTADIERVLTIGVHGPSRLILIAVDDETGGNA